MLSNHDIDELITKMNIPNFKGCYYKDKLKKNTTKFKLYH